MFMIRRGLLITTVALCPALLAACASPMEVRTRDAAGIAICYNRLNASLDAAQAVADNHCAKYGKRATLDGETVCGSETIELHRTATFTCGEAQ